MLKEVVDRERVEAAAIFADMRDFFESDINTKYLTSILTKESVSLVLTDIENIFIRSEDYERCAQIKKWKAQLEIKGI